MYKTRINFENGNYISFTIKLEIGCLRSGLHYQGVHNLLGLMIFKSSEYYIDMVGIENDIAVYSALPTSKNCNPNKSICNRLSTKDLCNKSYQVDHNGNSNNCSWSESSCNIGSYCDASNHLGFF